MKILILTLALLSFTGTHGRFLWQHDEPHPETKDPEKLFHNLIRSGLNLFSETSTYLESSELAKELKVKERVKAFKNNADHLLSVLNQYLNDVWKEVDKEMHEKYPVFRTKVVPILEDFHKRWEEYSVGMKKEVLDTVVDLCTNIKNQVHGFLENMRSTAESGRDKLRSEVEDLRARIAPYVKELREEMEKNRKDLKQDYEKMATETKEAVENALDELKKLTKPYVEKMKEHVVPHAEELQNHLEKIIEEIKTSLYNEDPKA
ncbi:uncharacterized protein RCH25_007939 [Pelodytes ibericus]